MGIYAHITTHIQGVHLCIILLVNNNCFLYFVLLSSIAQYYIIYTILVIFCIILKGIMILLFKFYSLIFIIIFLSNTIQKRLVLFSYTTHTLCEIVHVCVSVFEMIYIISLLLSYIFIYL